MQRNTHQQVALFKHAEKILRGTPVSGDCTRASDLKVGSR